MVSCHAGPKCHILHSYTIGPYTTFEREGFPIFEVKVKLCVYNVLSYPAYIPHRNMILVSKPTCV